MQEKVYKTKIANVDASLMRGKNLTNVWLTQQLRQWHARLRACVSARGGHWTYSVTDVNLVIYFEWLVPCLLLNCKHRFFLQKLRWAKLFCCSFQIPAFYKVWDNDIKVWWSVLLLSYLQSISTYLLKIWWKYVYNNSNYDEKRAVPFFRSQCIYTHLYVYVCIVRLSYRTLCPLSWLLLSKISSQITITYRKHTQVAWQAERLFNRLMRRLWNWKNIFGRNTEKTAGAKISFLFSTQCRTGLTLFNFRIVRPTVPLTCTFSRGCSYNSRLRLFYTTAFTIVRVVVINQNTSI